MYMVITAPRFQDHQIHAAAKATAQMNSEAQTPAHQGHQTIWDKNDCRPNFVSIPILIRAVMSSK